MKTYFFLLVVLVSSISFSQNNYIVKTEDGRRVLLKADFTWEYIDTEVPIVNTPIETITTKKENTTCNLGEDFVEPSLNKKIQSQLKKGRATMAHVKKKVAKENNSNVEDVTLIDVSEIKSKAVYHFCIKGKKVSYKLICNIIIKKEKLF